MPWRPRKYRQTRHALENAEQQYRIAERGVLGSDEATRYRIAEGLGDVLMSGGPIRRQPKSSRRRARWRRTTSRVPKF